jgi:outer membrane protein, heavy metal efflux system
VKSVGGRRAQAKANRSAAEALWAAPPALELSHRGEPLRGGSSGQRESEIGLAWPLLLPGQRAARGASAQADLDAAEAAERAAKLRIAGEVREAAWLLLARQAEAAVAEALQRSLQAVADDVERRVRSGDLARTDALAARAELLAARASAADARQRVLSARAQWHLRTGMDPLEDPGEAPVEQAVELHPELALAARSAEGARRRLQLVRSSRREPPELALRYRHEVPAANFPTENSIGIGVRIPFGTADRNLPREAAALAELDVAQAEERRLGERLEAEAGNARAAAAAAQEQLAAEEARAVLLRERGALLEKSFAAGETALPELLRGVAALAQSEGGVARQRAELGLARARLNQALGVLP